MAYLKSSQITGLSAKDVDVKGFTQADTINLGDRVYTEHEVLLADAYKIVGDVTVSDDLILSKLSDDGDDILLLVILLLGPFLVLVQFKVQLLLKLLIQHLKE